MESDHPASASSPDYPATELYIGGLRAAIHGLAGLPATSAVTAVHLLHPRLQTAEWMSAIAHEILAAAASPTICVSIEQRNHGTRLVDGARNGTWRDGNSSHAVDLLASYVGAVRDLQGVIDFLPAYLGRAVERHVVAGVSLGGHAAWIAVTQDPRIKAAAVVIGCADYCRLMRHRAEKSRIGGFEIGACAAFPPELLDAARRVDPAAIGVNEVARRLQGKKILCLSGAADKLVPYECNRAFLMELKYEQGIELVDKVYDGVGHECTPEMVRELAKWVRDVVENGRGRTACGQL